MAGIVSGRRGGTVARVQTRPTEETPGKARPTRDYSLQPGDAYLYEPGVLHSPRRDGSTRLLRIEGLNMDRVKRLSYVAVTEAVSA